MIAPLNDWLPSTLRKAQRIVEDSDRKSRADVAFQELLRRVHRIATQTAIRTAMPKLERYDNEDGVTLLVEWYDSDSMWHLYFCVRRVRGEKPVVLLDFSGQPKGYSAQNPSDDEIRKSLVDYFEDWK